MTHKPWSLRECIEQFSRRDVAGITVWRNVVEPVGAAEAGRMLRDCPLRTVALVRGGFFCAMDAAGRSRAIDDNRRIVDEAATIGAPMIVLVCGAVVGLPLKEARRQIADGIAAVVPHARSAGVKLAIEPLHPMYAADRSAVNTMAQANALCAAINDDHVGIALDVYHTWWDDQLEEQTAIAGAAGRLFAFHICDWRPDTRDLLNDRGLMGEGAIPIRAIREMVERSGFTGMNEVEIFSTQRWAGDQSSWLQDIVEAYVAHA